MPCIYKGYSHLIQNKPILAKQSFTTATEETEFSSKIMADLRLAILRQDKVLLRKVSNEIQHRIEQGDLWSGLNYGQALIATYNSEYPQAIIALQSAIIGGFTQFWLIEQDPQLQKLIQQNTPQILKLKQIIQKAKQKQASVAAQVKTIVRHGKN